MTQSPSDLQTQKSPQPQPKGRDWGDDFERARLDLDLLRRRCADRYRLTICERDDDLRSLVAGRRCPTQIVGIANINCDLNLLWGH